MTLHFPFLILVIPTSSSDKDHGTRVVSLIFPGEICGCLFLSRSAREPSHWLSCTPVLQTSQAPARNFSKTETRSGKDKSIMTELGPPRRTCFLMHSIVCSSLLVSEFPQSHLWCFSGCPFLSAFHFPLLKEEPLSVRPYNPPRTSGTIERNFSIRRSISEQISI